ncbi:MAG: carboxylating nicotinate-nucleotide diphosphorylase [Bacteroidetes bacterium]|nr:carboxylating nicotinate-nucleotide diphosphorylase [Bacteroidota bacterium]
MTIDTIIENALHEDIQDGDHSSLATIKTNAYGNAELIAKEKGIIAGISVAKKVFNKVDSEIIFNQLVNDGDEINPCDKIFIISGRSISILSAERVALNFLQRMSGIATSTNSYVQKLKGTKAKILDTRKTTPNLRLLEKEAVRLGGGENHRMGLYDMIMIKDNHIDFAGGIKQAIESTHAYLKRKNKSMKIEIEVQNFTQLEEVLSVGRVDRIMLDNFSPENTMEAVAIIDGTYETESSGGITLENIQDYAKVGTDYISVGALTHHIKSLDLSLKAF